MRGTAEYWERKNPERGKVFEQGLVFSFQGKGSLETGESIQEGFEGLWHKQSYFGRDHPTTLPKSLPNTAQAPRGWYVNVPRGIIIGRGLGIPRLGSKSFPKNCIDSIHRHVIPTNRRKM